MRARTPPLAAACLLWTAVNLALMPTANAYPTFGFSDDVSKVQPGGRFGNANIAKYEDGTSAKCKISHNVPEAGYEEGWCRW